MNKVTGTAAGLLLTIMISPVWVPGASGDSASQPGGGELHEKIYDVACGNQRRAG